MKRRLQTLARVVEVKEQQRRSAEWHLARLRQQELTLLEDQRAVIAALNAEQPLHGLFVEMMARQLRASSEKLTALRRGIELRAAELQGQTSQLKQAESMLRDATRAHDRVAEWKELSEVIEAAMARDDASLP